MAVSNSSALTEQRCFLLLVGVNPVEIKECLGPLERESRESWMGSTISCCSAREREDDPVRTTTPMVTINTPDMNTTILIGDNPSNSSK